jgi:hypothetical protein
MLPCHATVTLHTQGDILVPGFEELAMSNNQASPGRIREVFRAFLLLGLTSFGGPIAHLGYFRIEFVERRRWLSEQAYADLVALCQFLPGLASSQVGFALGLMRAGPWGGQRRPGRPSPCPRPSCWYCSPWGLPC